MRHARTLDVGRDGHQDALAVASVAQDHDAEGIDLGPVGTRPADLDHRGRTRHANAPHLGLVDDAGPGGAWRSRDWTTNGPGGWVVATRSPWPA